MNIECIDNGGFEDQLTASSQYRVKEIGHNGYLIENDNEQARWYGESKFSMKMAE